MDPHEPKVFQRLDRIKTYPYTRSEYLRRFAWNTVQSLLIRTSPGRAMGWRRFWLRFFGAKVGKLSGIRPTTRIVHPWLLTLEDFAILGDGVTVYRAERGLRGSAVDDGLLRFHFAHQSA